MLAGDKCYGKQKLSGKGYPKMFYKRYVAVKFTREKHSRLKEEHRKRLWGRKLKIDCSIPSIVVGRPVCCIDSVVER